MAGDFGVSFVPNAQGGNPDKIKDGANVNPIQQAIRFLSLRLPARISGAPIAPQALLQGAGGAGLPSVDSVVAQIMKRIVPTGAPGETAAGPVATPTVPQQQGMQAPSGSFSVTSPTQGVLSKSPLAQMAGQPIRPTTNVAPTPTPTPRFEGGGSRPDMQPGPIFVPNTPSPPGMPLPPLGPGPTRIPDDVWAQRPTNDVFGNQVPEGQTTTPDTTPSVEPEAPPQQPMESGGLSPEIQDLLDRLRQKYSQGYGENYEG